MLNYGFYFGKFDGIFAVQLGFKRWNQLQLGDLLVHRGSPRSLSVPWRDTQRLALLVEGRLYLL